MRLWFKPSAVASIPKLSKFAPNKPSHNWRGFPRDRHGFHNDGKDTRETAWNLSGEDMQRTSVMKFIRTILPHISESFWAPIRDYPYVITICYLLSILGVSLCYPLVYQQFDPENHHLLAETNLPRVYPNRTGGNHPKVMEFLSKIMENHGNMMGF